MMYPTTIAAFLFLLGTVFCAAAAAPAHTCPLTHVCFALDSSGSMHGHWDKVQKFTVDVAASLRPLSLDYGPQYSAWAFADSVDRLAIPTKSILWFTEQIGRPHSTGGGTNMYAGIKACFDHLESISGKRVVVLLTDGQDNGKPRAEELVRIKKASGIQIVTVGIGSGINEAYLKRLVSKDTFFVSTSMASLTDKATATTRAVCNAAMESPETCIDAYHACDFKFAGRDTPPVFWSGGRPDRPLGSKIISRSGSEIGIVNTNGIVPEFVNEDGTCTSVDQLGAPRFALTHFKPFPMRGSNFASSVGRQSFAGNQKTIVKGKCIRMYFSTYQEITSGPRVRVVNNVNVNKDDNKCVVFKLS